MACADVATAKAKAATAINLNIGFLPCLDSSTDHALSRKPLTQIKPRGPSSLAHRRLRRR
jgi:hypothetical protein